jgi:hypothetical protein
MRYTGKWSWNSEGRRNEADAYLYYTGCMKDVASIKEPLRYISNAKETLTKSSIEGTRYADEKYVKSACGIACLGVLKAISTCLLSNGLTKKELPKKAEGYQKALQKYATPYNGKLLRQFNDIYDELHIAGYYRGQLHSVAAVKAALSTAEDFIRKLLR